YGEEEQRRAAGCIGRPATGGDSFTASEPPRRPTPAAGAGSRRRRRRPIRRALRHAAEHEATKAHRLLALGVPATDVRHAREPNSAAGRRGRRRSAYEAPRAAADRATPLGGAESKRRRRPRLPAPPSQGHAPSPGTLLRPSAGGIARREARLQGRCIAASRISRTRRPRVARPLLHGTPHGRAT